MKVTFAQACSDVRLMLNRDEQHQSLIDCDDIATLSLDRIIHSLLPEAVRRAEVEAPVTMLDGDFSFASGSLGQPEAGLMAQSGLTEVRVALPADFLRLVSFRLADWGMAVTEPVGPESQLFAMMQMPGAGALAGNDRPLAAIVRGAQGLTLTCYCRTPPASATVVEALYRPLPEFDATDIIEVSRRLYVDAVGRCAAACRQMLADSHVVDKLLT